MRRESVFRGELADGEDNRDSKGGGGAHAAWFLKKNIVSAIPAKKSTSQKLWALQAAPSVVLLCRQKSTFHCLPFDLHSHFQKDQKLKNLTRASEFSEIRLRIRMCTSRITPFRFKHSKTPFLVFGFNRRCDAGKCDLSFASFVLFLPPLFFGLPRKLNLYLFI